MAYHDPRLIVLQHGERYSGKTFAALHALVRHMYLNMNPIGMIMTIVKATGEIGGIWKKLNTVETDEHGNPLGVLHIWQQAMGLEFSEPKQDQSRNHFVEIKNQYGQINRVYFKSLPPGELISARTRGIEFTFCVIDEISESNRSDHVTKTIQQLYRRQGVGRWADEDQTEWIRAHQQLYLCTNPPDEGPDHWLFKEWAIDIPANEGRPAVGEVQGKIGVWLHNDDPEFAHYHIPVSENRWADDRQKEIIMSSIRKQCASDPTAEDRLIHGIWSKKITGRGIFQDYWVPQIHVPNLDQRTVLVPKPGFPIIVGWDPGDTNIGRCYMQRFVIKGKSYYRIFDATLMLKSRSTYELIVENTFNTLVKWNEEARKVYADSSIKFSHLHVSDLQAFVKYLNDSGSFENMQYEIQSRILIEQFEDRYADMHPIIFEAPPKAKESVEARVRLIQTLLQEERIFVCQSCEPAQMMFAQLKKASDGRGNEFDYKPKKDANGWIHLFDAMSYPIYLYEGDPSNAHVSAKTERRVAFSTHRI